MKEAPGMPFLHAGLRSLLLLLLLTWLASGQFHVIGPRSPVITKVGAEASFSCRLSPATNAQNMKVSWYHRSPSGHEHYYRDSQDGPEQQRSEYRGRTQFLKENITTGQVSLRISPISPVDEGDYRCLFESSTEYWEADFHVIVTASGLAPHIHVEPGQTGNIKLTCTSTSWYPKPEVQWSGPGRLNLEPDSEESTVEGSGLFRVVSSVTVMESSREDVSCFFRNPVLNEQLEAHMSMAGDLFPRVSSWTVVLTVVLSLLIIVLMLAGAVLLRTKRDKGPPNTEQELLIQFNENNIKKYDTLCKDCDVLKNRKGLMQAQNEKISSQLAERESLGAEGLRIIRAFAEDITLDKDTAHPSLEVSSDSKSVKSVTTQQDVPDNPKRFSKMPAVLGQNRFSSGSHYWEVEVGGDSNWTLGLCADSLNRKEKYLSTKTQRRLWTLCLKDGRYKALSVSYYDVHVPGPFLRVGILLQYEQGLISFYNLTQFAILHTFKSKFTEGLRPYFCPGPASEENSYGLKIVQVPAAAEPAEPADPV